MSLEELMSVSMFACAFSRSRFFEIFFETDPALKSLFICMKCRAISLFKHSTGLAEAFLTDLLSYQPRKVKVFLRVSQYFGIKTVKNVSYRGSQKDETMC